ncbi:DUF2165 family protein [Xenorhabdus stockiae]|uniref:DUF2165 family protein n=1 Tax=Xenorhabdus stockiae TaxID=351614 RepID=UPI00406441BA
MKSVIFAKTIIIAGMALWMSILVLNNMLDPGTNIHNINDTVTMDLLKNDPILGVGLKWRAWPPGYAGIILKFIVAYQLLIVLSFWFTAYRYVKVLLNKLNESVALMTANIALTIFSCHWIAFLSGGTWFGYWIKQGAFTGVHMSMFALTIILLIFFNQKSNETR